WVAPCTMLASTNKERFVSCSPSFAAAMSLSSTTLWGTTIPGQAAVRSSRHPRHLPLGHRDHRMIPAPRGPRPPGGLPRSTRTLSASWRPVPRAFHPSGRGVSTDDTSHPDRLLDRIAGWIPKHTPSGAPRDLLRRIERLLRDIQTLTQPTRK